MRVFGFIAILNGAIDATFKLPNFGTYGVIFALLAVAMAIRDAAEQAGARR